MHRSISTQAINNRNIQTSTINRFSNPEGVHAMRTFLACVAFVVTLSHSVSAQEHLVPDVDAFADPDSYLLKARKVFIHAFDNGVVARVLVLPSFRKEFCIGVSAEGEAVEAFVLEASYSIWSTVLVDDCQEEIDTLVLNGENVPPELLGSLKAFKKQAVEFRTIKAMKRSRSIPRELCEEIKAVWEKVLLDVRHPKEDVNGLDGVSYHFSTFIKGRGDLSGQTWSPNEGSKMDRLTSLAETIGEYARGKVDLTMLKKKLEEARASIKP
jgi:hypothetical protein